MNNKQNKSGGIVGSVIMIIVCAFLTFVLFVSEMDNLFGEPRDLNAILADGASPQKGEYVSVGVDAVVDWYAETTYKINGIIPAGKKQHCILWLDDGSFISMTVKGKNVDTVNRLINETEKYLNRETEYLPTPVVFTGKISSIGTEVNQYWHEGLSYYGISEYDPELTVYSLTIDTTETKTQMWLMIALFGALTILFVIILIANIKKKKKIKEADAQAAAYNAAQANNAAFNGGMYNNGNMYGGQDNMPYGTSDTTYGGSAQNTPYNDNNNNLYS